MIHALTNGLVLRDSGFAEGLAVLIDGTRISAVVPEDDPRVATATTHDLGGNLLLPGFIDTQVNGGGGVLFNDAPTRRNHPRDRRGAPAVRHHWLPAHADQRRSRGDRERARGGDRGDPTARVPGVLGIHIEGPFLNPERKGAHDGTKLRELDAAAVELLTTPTGGTHARHTRARADDAGVVRELSRMPASSSPPATRTPLTRTCAPRSTWACAASPTCSTRCRRSAHASPALSAPRSRTPRASAASSSTACTSIPSSLRIALRSRPHDRFVLVTDAMPNIGSDLTEFQLAGKRVTVYEDRLVDEDGTLAGANLTMARAVANAVELLDVDLRRAVRMASAQPAAYLKLDRVLGRIEAGYLAGLVLADEKLNVIETWIEGASMTHRELVPAPGFERAALRSG